MVTLSRDGYAKRVSLRSYGAAGEAMTGIKEGDELLGYVQSNTINHLLFFTTAGTYGYVPVYALEEGKWKEIGSHVNSLIRMTSNEKITDAFIVSDFSSQAYIISVTKHGLIKKTKLSEYEVSRNNKTMSNMKLLDGDAVVKTMIAYAYDEILITSKNGFVSRYPVSLIPETSPRSKGVKAMNLVLDEIVSACISHGDASQLIVFTDQCQMKRIKLSDVDVTGRPTKGSMICKKVKSKPYQIAHIALHDLNDELVIINEETQKILAKDISLMSKDATFSSPLHTTQDYYFLRTLAAVEQRELPAIQGEKQEFEEIELFED